MQGPKSTESKRQKLISESRATARLTAKAMKAASDTIDAQSQELIALRRILISERAQLIFYTERCLDYAERRCLDLVVPNFMELAEDVQEEFVKRAYTELTGEVRPHEAESKKVTLN